MLWFPCYMPVVNRNSAVLIANRSPYALAQCINTLAVYTRAMRLKHLHCYIDRTKFMLSCVYKELLKLTYEFTHFFHFFLSLSVHTGQGQLVLLIRFFFYFTLK